MTANAYSALFLDLDGVVSINQPAFGPALSAFARLVPDRVTRLNQIVARTGCRVVVSSTWRLSTISGYGMRAHVLQSLLRQRGFDHAIHDADVERVVRMLERPIRGRRPWSPEDGAFIGATKIPVSQAKMVQAMCPGALEWLRAGPTDPVGVRRGGKMVAIVMPCVVEEPVNAKGGMA